MNQYSAIIPRAYMLSHCDFTADLITLIVSNVINLDQFDYLTGGDYGLPVVNIQLRGWYSKDDVGQQEQFYITEQLILPSFCLKTRNALTSMTFYEQQSPQVAPKI
ncbi:hypothetical protein NC652_005829 [Populus alba x Populus x berolinensis]|nr:hypothetical protein NC652_005829 [Populus alba x Populus x berolinensis]